MKKRIIITGGLGFIFSHVSEYFIVKGYEVHVIDNLSAGSHPELINKFQMLAGIYGTKFFFYELDCSFSPVQGVIERIDPHYIVHAAAISDVDYSIGMPQRTILANNNATINVFEAARLCKNLERLLYASTDEVYGECDHAKGEEDIIFPKNPYALSKAFGSLMRLAYDNTYPELRDKTCETRFCNVFGPRQDARKILPAIKRALQGGEPVKLHNEGKGYRQFIYVAEIPEVVELLLEKGHRTYNITSAEGFTVLELIELAEKITGKKVPTVPGGRSGMDMRYEMSPARIYSEFQWSPKQTFEERFAPYLSSHEDLT